MHPQFNRAMRMAFGHDDGLFFIATMTTTMLLELVMEMACVFGHDYGPPVLWSCVWPIMFTGGGGGGRSC